MFLSQYPYLNLNDFNLDYILKTLRALSERLENFIVLNTIKYANPIQWNITTQYEANTVVIEPNGGTAYLSVKPVPTGVAITNTDYWTPIFTLNFGALNRNITLRDDGSNVLATFSSNSGDWLMWNGILYKVTRPINTNEQYLVGYNIERYTVEMFISDYVDLLTNEINSLTNKMGDLNDLNTTDKTSIVNAINELFALINTVSSNSPIVTPEMFGAIGDGVTDDTSAIQNAINAGFSIYCRKTYKVTSTLFIDGAKRFYGDGTFHLYLSEAENFFIVLGATAMGVAGETFTGEIDGINVVAHGGHRYNYVIGGVNACDCVVRNCTFNFEDGDCHNKIIFFGDNAAIAADSGNKSNYLVDNNRFIFKSTVGNSVNQCEPIGFGWRNDIVVSNNLSKYAKDDFGFHGCKNVIVKNNVLDDNFTARIFFSNCQEIVVDGNIINEHPDYTTQGIQLDLESGYTSLPPAGFEIVNNIITYWASNIERYSYGIRIVGWQRGIIANNNLISFSAYHGRIFLENCEPFDGFDDTRLVQDVIIENNRCSAIAHSVNGSSADAAIEPIIVRNNEVRHAISLNSYYDYSSGNNLFASSGTITLATNPSRFNPNLVFTSDSVTNSYTALDVEGLKYFDAKSRYYVRGLCATYITPYNALDNSNYLTFDVRVNGVSKGTFDVSSNAAYGSVPSFILSNDDDLSVYVKSTGSVTATNIVLKLKLSPVTDL